MGHTLISGTHADIPVLEEYIKCRESRGQFTIAISLVTGQCLLHKLLNKAEIYKSSDAVCLIRSFSTSSAT